MWFGRFWNAIQAISDRRKDEKESCEFREFLAETPHVPKDSRAFREFIAQTSDPAQSPSGSPGSRLFMFLLLKWMESGIDTLELSHKGGCMCLWASDVWQHPIDMQTWGPWLVLVGQHSVHSVAHDLWTEHRIDLHRDGQSIPVYIRLQRLGDPRNPAAFEEQLAKLAGQPEMVWSRQPM